MAKLRPVKCLYCGNQIDRNIEPFEQIKNRYAHAECVLQHEANKTQEQKDKEALVEYIQELYGQVLPLHHKQIKTMAEQGYSYSGMLKTLQYFYEIKGNSKDKSKGIGIIPYVYKEAYEYYLKLFNIKENAQQLTQNQLDIKTTVVRIRSPKIKPKRGKKIDLDKLEGEINNEQ